MTLLQKMLPTDKPPKEGQYITNFGDTKWDGKKWLMPGHSSPVPTIVQYWLQEYKQET